VTRILLNSAKIASCLDSRLTENALVENSARKVIILCLQVARSRIIHMIDLQLITRITTSEVLSLAFDHARVIEKIVHLLLHSSRAIVISIVVPLKDLVQVGRGVLGLLWALLLILLLEGPSVLVVTGFDLLVGRVVDRH